MASSLNASLELRLPTACGGPKETDSFLFELINDTFMAQISAQTPAILLDLRGLNARL